MTGSFCLGLYVSVLLGALPHLSLSESFSLTYHTAGGLPNAPNLAGDICYQEESVIIDPTGMTRIMSCSPLSTDSPNAILSQVHVGVDDIQLSNIIDFLNSLLVSGASPPPGNDSYTPDDWTVVVNLKTPFLQRTYAFPRHHVRLPAGLSQFTKSLESFIEEHLQMPSRGHVL